MNAIDALRAMIPEHSNDIEANLRKVLTGSKLTPARMWGTALACAITARDGALVQAVEKDARAAGVAPEVLDDARAAASLMAMTNVYYRFKHMMDDADIDALPARLRMKRTARPKGEKADYEIFCVAVSAINGCASCVRHHAQKAIDLGLSKEELAESVRIAATFQATAIALVQARASGLSVAGASGSGPAA